MNKPKARTPRRLVAGLAAGTLVLAACGSDSNDAEEVETTEAVEEAGTIVDVAVANGSFDTLVAAVTAADLVETLSSEGPFTVFAPTDDAFAALPDGLLDALLLPENVDALQAILTYHVLGAEVPSADVAPGDVTTVQGEDITIAADGDTLTVNDATITAVDVEASNGVIHVIDSVLVPPSIDAAALIAADAGGDEQAAELGTIIDVATEAGNFTTLLAAGEASGISAVLDAPGEYTIFAPTDEAFEALPEGLVDALLLPENSAALSAILTYHGLLGVVPSTAVEAGDVTTIQGEDITFAIDGDTITINDTATITAVDLEASNGVIHVIDAVLVPPSIDPAALLG